MDSSYLVFPCEGHCPFVPGIGEVFAYNLTVEVPRYCFGDHKGKNL